MLRSLAIGRALARRRQPPLLRRHMHDAPENVEAKISKLNEEQRAELSKHLDKMGRELDGKLVQEVDTYLQRPTFYNDQGKVNWVLNFCRVPKGERREKLIWHSNLAISFITSWAIGNWGGSKCMQYHHEYQQGEETANHAA